MGKLEERAKKKRKKDDYQKVVLGIIGMAGVIVATAVALPLMAGIAGIAKQSGYRARQRAKTVTGRLAAKGLVRFVKKNGNTYVELTEAGRRHLTLEQARLESLASKSRRWDRRYRLVMFDIPQKRRATRDRLRSLMRDFGFLRLQDSVWVSPYDREDIIALVKAELKIGKDVLYAVVDQIENDSFIREHFHLS